MTLVFCGLLVSASAAFTQDGARAIIEKAVQAQGGEAKVAKLRTMRIKVEGTTDLVPGQPDLPFTIEDSWQMPNQYKSSFSFQLSTKMDIFSSWSLLLRSESSSRNDARRRRMTFM